MAVDLSLQSQTPRVELGRRFDGWTTDRVIAAGMAVALTAVVAQAITQIVDFSVYDLRIGALNSDVHASIFGVLSLIAEGVMAVAAGFRGLHSHQRSRWLGLAALAAALVAVRAALPGSAAAFAVPCAAVFALVWSLTSADPRAARTVVLASLFLLVFSFAIHIVELELGNVGKSWPDEIKCLFKHSAELSGWILLATGVVAGMLPDRPDAVS
ncbi:MAG: hypothetical protein JO027_17315 [Solirubrobacterales bacterium]|nr:hypothetical protein [Solirubrobacterales bacterium]